MSYVAPVYLLFIDYYYINEEYPIVLNVVYCRRVVMTGVCRTALSGPAPDRPGICLCYCYIRVATIVALLLNRCTIIIYNEVSRSIL